MGVKIVADFWTNVSEHKETINRLFNYLIRMYPTNEGNPSAFADLMVKFEENGIFQRFNPNHEKLAQGKTEDKAFEQFLLSWIRHYLEEAYFKRQKYSYRHCSIGNEEVESMDPTYYDRNKDRVPVDLFDESVDERINSNRRKATSPVRIVNKASVQEKVTRQKDTTRVINKARIYPHLRDSDNSHKEMDALENVEMKETVTRILAILKTDTERKVIEQRLKKGSTMIEVAKEVNITTAAVSALLIRVRERCIRQNILNIP